MLIIVSLRGCVQSVIELLLWKKKHNEFFVLICCNLPVALVLSLCTSNFYSLDQATKLYVVDFCCWVVALMTHAQLFAHLSYLSKYPEIYYICRRKGTHSSPIYYFSLFLLTSWKIMQMKGIHPGTHRNLVFML